MSDRLYGSVEPSDRIRLGRQTWFNKIRYRAIRLLAGRRVSCLINVKLEPWYGTEPVVYAKDNEEVLISNVDIHVGVQVRALRR